MEKIAVLIVAFICIFGLSGCVPAPGSSGPGRPIAAYIADDVTKAEITHRSGEISAEWTVEGEEPLREWASGLKYELPDSEEEPEGRDGGKVYEIVLTEGYYPGFSYVIHGADDGYLLIEGYWYSVTNPSDPPIASPADRGAVRRQCASRKVYHPGARHCGECRMTSGFKRGNPYEEKHILCAAAAVMLLFS